jgi:undecaprenyl-diphosphatase
VKHLSLGILLLIHLSLLAAMFAARPWIVRVDHAYDRAMYHRVTGRAEDVCYIMLQPGTPEIVGGIAIVVAVALVVRREWFRLGVWIVYACGAAVLGYLLKQWFHRGRPLNMGGMPAGSFPSGHTLIATAVYGMIAYLFGSRASRRGRAIWTAGAALLVLSTAIGLLLPGYHFLSDVLAGYLVGATWLIVGVWFIRRRETRFIDVKAVRPV